MTSALATLLFCLIAACNGAGHDRVACRDCNVILISMDTLRADHVGAYGYPRPTTPSIDRLAAHAVVFEDAISQSAWTRPAHFSMFTGLYPREHGVVAMTGHARLRDGTPTLAAILAGNGYRTASFNGGANLSAHFGFDDGFEVYESAGKRMLDNVDAAVSWVRQHADEKFFLFFHGLDAHKRYVAEPEDRRALQLSPAPATGWKRHCSEQQAPHDVGPFLDNYDAAIHRGDRALGRLFDALESMGLFERTIVIVTSDHGEEFFEHGGCYHIRTLYREIVHVPLIVFVPGVSARRISGPVPASVAVGPTVLALVGLAGRLPVAPSLAGDIVGGTAPRPVSVVSETASRWHGPVLSLTTEHYKLVEWQSTGRTEVFDRRYDAGEQRPLADAKLEQRLRSELESWLFSHRPMGRAASSSDAIPLKLEKELRALGYVD